MRAKRALCRRVAVWPRMSSPIRVCCANPIAAAQLTNDRWEPLNGCCSGFAVEHEPFGIEQHGARRSRDLQRRTFHSSKTAPKSFSSDGNACAHAGTFEHDAANSGGVVEHRLPCEGRAV
jgi:hypothetical protein